MDKARFVERTLFYNARILTQNPIQPVASAMLVEGGTILDVGNEIVVEAGTQKVDMKGRTLFPGFNDAHIHLWKVGQLSSFIIDLRGVKSVPELQSRVKAVAEKVPPGRWITGRGFNEALLEEKRMPSMADLDEVSLQHPIYLIRTCAHIAVVNHRALELSGVTSYTPAPDGGVIGKDEKGNLTGAFYETALGLVARLIPEPSQHDYLEMIRAGVDQVLRHGITSITDPAAHPELLQAYHIYAQSDPKIRVNVMPILLPDGGANPFPLPPLYHSNFLSIDTVKFFSDGGLSGQTAALSRPYKNSANLGVLRLEFSRFYDLAREAQQKGFRVATHAIGDRAIELVIRVYKKLQAEFGDCRNRVEHFGLPTAQHISDMAKHRFVAVTQPVFLRELGANFIETLDETFLSDCYPVASLLKENIPVAFSTDAPVVANVNPWNNIQCAMQRQSQSGKTIASNESVGLQEAIHAYTAGSAYAEGKEDQKGMIVPGQWADFIITDRDPFDVPEGQLHTVTVEETWVNGICRWLRK